MRFIISISAVASLSSAALWGSQAESDALATIRAADAHNQLSSVADALMPLTKSTDPAVRNEAWFYLGKACQSLGKTAEASRIWSDNVLRLDPGSDLWGRDECALGCLYANQGDANKGLAELQEVIERCPHSRAAFDAALAAAGIFSAQGQPVKAVHALEFAQRLSDTDLYDGNPAAIGIDRAALAKALADARRKVAVADQGEDEVLFKEAEAAMARRAWDEAKAKYADLITRYPKSALVPHAAWRTGDCLIGLGKLDEAKSQLTLFISANPKGPWRGQAMISLGDLLLERYFDEATAAACFNQAYGIWSTQKDDPTWGVEANAILQRLGLMAYLGGDHGKAMDWFSQASIQTRTLPYSTGSSHSNGYEALLSDLRNGRQISQPEVLAGDPATALVIAMGDIAFTCDDHEGAERCYNRILAPDFGKPVSDIQSAWAHLQLGRIANLHFRFDAALKEYATVSTDHAHSPYAANALLLAGIVDYSNLKKPEEAIVCYQHIVNDHPDSDLVPQATMYIGLVYQWTGRAGEARQIYRSFLSQFPNSPYASAVRDDLLPAVIPKKQKSGNP
jgi:tetratricopeptide (TPR) repeat protein